MYAALVRIDFTCSLFFASADSAFVSLLFVFIFVVVSLRRALICDVVTSKSTDKKKNGREREREKFIYYNMTAHVLFSIFSILVNLSAHSQQSSELIVCISFLFSLLALHEMWQCDFNVYCILHAQVQKNEQSSFLFFDSLWCHILHILLTP